MASTSSAPPRPEEYAALSRAPADATLAAWWPELRELPAAKPVRFAALLRGLPPRDMRPPPSELRRLDPAALRGFELKPWTPPQAPAPEEAPPAAAAATKTDRIMALAIELFEAKPANVQPIDWLNPDPRTLPKRALATSLIGALDQLRAWREQYAGQRDVIDRLLAALQSYSDKLAKRTAGTKRPLSACSE